MAASWSRPQKRLSELEMMSNTMLNTLANSGAEIDDTPMILNGAGQRCAQIAAAIEAAIDRGEISIDDVFDRNYRERPGSNPQAVSTPTSATSPTATSSRSSTASSTPTTASSAPPSAT